MADRKSAENVVRLPVKKKSKHPDWAFFCEENGDGKAVFRVPKFGDYIRQTTPVMKGGGELYVYSNGVYRPGEDFLRSLIAEILDLGWRRALQEDTLVWLKTQAEAISDSPPHDVINVRNGLLRINARGDVKLTPHDPRLGLTMQLPVTYDPKARCPEIEKFLSLALPEELDRHAALEIAGYMLVADNSLQKAFMLLGEGGNGRSTFLNLLTALLGTANVAHRPLQQFDADRFAAADLYGKLANIAADLSSDELRKTGVFKSITGGDPISAERKYGHSFSFVPFARLIFSCNEIPVSRDGSLAYQDRWFVMRWEQRIRGTADDERAIIRRLTTDAELSGLLNLALAGLKRLRRARGEFSTSAASYRARLQFLEQSNTVGEFAAHYQPRSGSWRKQSDVYQAYVAWCQERKLRVWSAKQFHAAYQKLGVASARTRRGGNDGYKYL